MPAYLVGGDYVKTFNNDKFSKIEVYVTLVRPAYLYVLFDKRGVPPKWLRDEFEFTGDDIGVDAAHASLRMGPSSTRMGRSWPGGECRVSPLHLAAKSYQGRRGSSWPYRRAARRFQHVWNRSRAVALVLGISDTRSTQFEQRNVSAVA